VELLVVMALKNWKCLDCESIRNHKGLCRDCTEYDGDGEIINPTHRVRLNSDGTIYEPTQRVKLPIIRGDKFNRTKKPTKKQLKKMEEEFTKYIPSKENQVMLMGESDEEE
tara:strand:+ start:2570 stop:2902 length:333 start_codon:yes stop_codon:yes gene_type:complete